MIIWNCPLLSGLQRFLQQLLKLLTCLDRLYLEFLPSLVASSSSGTEYGHFGEDVKKKALLLGALLLFSGGSANVLQGLQEMSIEQFEALFFNHVPYNGNGFVINSNDDVNEYVKEINRDEYENNGASNEYLLDYKSWKKRNGPLSFGIGSISSCNSRGSADRYNDWYGDFRDDKTYQVSVAVEYPNPGDPVRRDVVTSLTVPDMNLYLRDWQKYCSNGGPVDFLFWGALKIKNGSNSKFLPGLYSYVLTRVSQGVILGFDFVPTKNSLHTPGNGPAVPGNTPNTGNNSGGNNNPAPVLSDATKCNIIDIPCNMIKLFVPRDGFLENHLKKKESLPNIYMPVKVVDSFDMKELMGNRAEVCIGAIDAACSGPVSILPKIDFTYIRFPYEFFAIFKFVTWWAVFFFVLHWLGLPIMQSAKKEIREATKP